MSGMSSIAGRLIHHIKEYADVKLELFKLEAIERNAKIASVVLVAVVLGLAGVLFVLMLSIAAAFWLGTVLGAWHWGFLAVSGFYLLLGIAFYIFRNAWIYEPITNMVINHFLDDQENEKNERDTASPNEGTAP